jgi:hypothetical protein
MFLYLNAIQQTLRRSRNSKACASCSTTCQLVRIQHTPSLSGLYEGVGAEVGSLSCLIDGDGSTALLLLLLLPLLLPPLSRLCCPCCHLLPGAVTASHACPSSATCPPLHLCISRNTQHVWVWHCQIGRGCWLLINWQSLLVAQHVWVWQRLCVAVQLVVCQGLCFN